MPEKKTLQRAAEDKRQGKSPSTQAGEFIREEIHHVREGKHGARSTQQAIAIGLSKARRAGVKLLAAGVDGGVAGALPGGWGVGSGGVDRGGAGLGRALTPGPTLASDQSNGHTRQVAGAGDHAAERAARAALPA